MDQDKIDKTIEIILQNQAQFYADLQQTQETQLEIQKAQQKSEKRVATLEKVSSLVLKAVKQTNENVKELSKTVDGVSKNVDGLRIAQKETDERLNAVIFMAEKFFGGRNGKSE